MNSENPSENDSNDGGTGSDHTPNHSPNFSGARKKKSKSKKGFGLRQQLGKLGNILKNPFHWKDKSKKLILDETFMHDNFNIFLNLDQLGKDGREVRNSQDEKSNIASAATPQIRFDDSDTIKVYFICFKHPIFDKKGLNVLLNVFGLGAGRSRPIPMTETQLFINEETHKSCLIHELSISKKDLTDRDNKLLYQYQIVWYNPELQKEVVFNEQIYVAMEQRVESFYRLLEINQDHHLLENSMYFQIDDFVLLPSKVDMLRESYYQEYRKYQMENRKGLYLSLLKSNLYYISQTIPLKSLYEYSLFVRGVFEGAARSNVISHENRPVTWKTGIIVREEIRDMQIQLLKTYDIHKSILQGEESSFDERVGSFIFILSSLYSYLPLMEGLGCKQQILRYAFNGLSLETLYRGMSMKDYFDHDILNILKRQFPEQVLRKIGIMLAALLKKGLEQNHSDHIKDNWCSVLVLCHVISFQRELFIGDQTHKEFSKKEVLQGIDKNEFPEYIKHLLLENLSSYSFSLRIDPAFQKAVLLLAGSHLENVVNSGLFSFTKIANHIQEFLNTEQLVPEDLQHLSLSIAQIPMEMIDDNIEGFVKLLKVVVDKLPVTQLTRDLYDAIITKLLTWTRSNGDENEAGDDNEAGDVDDEKKYEKSIPKETPVNEEKLTTPPSEEFSVQAEAGSEKPPINDEENPSNAAGLPQDGSRYINSTLEKALANTVVSLTENFDLRIWYDVDSWFVHSGLKLFNDLLNLIEQWGLGSLIFEIVQKLEKSFKALRNNAHGDYKLVGLNTDNYRPEITFMMETFIADATLAFFKAFFVLDINNITKHSETDKNILYMQMSGRNCHVVVTSFLEEWVKLETLEQKTHYLLFWPSMAAFVEFTWNTNDAGQEVGPFRNVRYEILITLDELEKKLISFELPLLLLKSIKRKKETFIAIFMMVKGGVGRTTIDQLERNLQRLKEFDEASDILKFFNETMKKAGSRIIDTRPLEGLLAQASDGDLTFAELEIKAPGDAWKYYNVNSTDVIVNFFKLRLGDSKIFARSWELFLRDYTSIDSLAKVDPIVDLLLTPTLQNLKDFMMSLDQGKADVAMIDLYLNWPVTKALNEAGEETTETKSVNHFTPNQLQEELLVLYRYFGIKENVNHEKKDKFIRKLTTNCFCYLRVKSLAKAYKNVLQIKEALQLTGDFTNIETLDQMDLFDQNKPISEYSEELQKSLVEISNTEEKVFENVLNNINFFLWMRESMKGPQEVKTFVDLVTNSAGESDYEHDRILDFESVCQAFRPIIFNVRRDASFDDLHIACNETSIHTNTDIFYKLSDCKRNLEWFKHMKRIQGSASTKTFEQIKAINKKGEYTIGIAEPDYEMFLTEDIDMKKVVRLQFTSKKTGTRDLLLTEIEDLQSSLMLLGREARGGAENHDEAETEKTIFVQHTELAIQLGTLYVDLCQMGDVASFNWNISFPCNIYSTTEGDPEKKSRQLYEIYAEIKKMEERRNKLNSLLEVHTNYPALNYFTNKQCLLLQKYFYQRDGNLLLNVIGLLRLTPGRKNMTMKTARQFIDFILKNSATIDDEKSIVDVGTAPFQSLSFVGRVLNVNKENNAYSIPSYINCNKPTLVSLPKDEVLQFVLGMYFEYNGELPNQENILVCTKETTLEQVKLLMLRVGYNKDGLYCLVFADSMNYIACEKAVDFMNQIMRNGREMGKFVFVCCTENESKSNLVASLDTYRTRKSLEYTETEQRLRDKLCMRPIYKTHSGLNFASKTDVEDFNTRIITSSEGGMGKSLYVDERKEIMLSSCYGFTSSEKASKNILTIRVQGTAVDVVEIVERLQEINSQQMDDHPKFYHFDVAPTVTEGVDALFFNVVILGMLQTPLGKVWHKNQQDYVIIEMTTTHTSSVSNFMAMLPQTRCVTPQETINFYKNDEVISPTKYCQLNLLSLEPFRRVHTYLEAYAAGEEILNQLAYFVASEEGLTILQKVSMLEMFVMKCGVLNPTWMEIRNFVYFFNMQLMDSENCIYTSVECSEMFPGFKNFVLKFLLRMAKDFSTRSLGDDDTNKLESGGFLLELKTKWEQSHHPYLFFNKDGGTFTFFGLNINQAGDLVHKRPNGSNEIVEPQLMNSKLHGILSENMKFDIVNFASDYQKLPREKKLTILYRVLIGGSDFNFDPDPNYQLTVDNMKKMLAIFTRIKCSIPVILMGETGCGKTSLITFMCKILAKSKEASNLVLVKIHGGVTKQHIMQHVQNAKKLAKKSGDKKTILFFDEANTTDAIGLIKEIIIDKSLNGELLGLEENNMVVIAACNPYRRHSQDMIERLESAGLGYHVGTDQTYEKIGQIPLRQLVYRVHPLPESMKPLVWDFGQLDDVTEELYTREIVNSAFKERKLPQNDTDFIENLISLLTASQKYMRSRKNECSFVSLRDVERSVQVASWFYKVYTGYQLQNCPKDILKQILILTIAVCYIARLEKRHEFLKYIAPFFKGRFHFDGGTLKLKELIKDYQREFVDDLQVKENIAKNEALCENIFMMVVCIELRIPLFIVGKPGSSKSLAKTIIQDNMQGSSSASPLFRKFKEIFVTSYQCSPHSTADGIISVFRQAQNYQQDRNLDLFASVVVLDEVGLAEDSPKMPLKALHPLLEDGTDGFEDLRDAEKEEARYRKTTGAEKRVAFIGISNWALDPAKMNRGIMLKRNMLDLTELISTASEICSSNERIRDKIKFLLKPLSEAFYKLYNMQKENPTLIKHRKEEFFGMRDFYSLIKMIFCAAKFYNGMPPLHEIELAVLRNFSGLEQYDMWAIFRDVLTSSPLANALGTIELEISAADMIRKNFEKNCLCCSLTPTVKRCQTNRYLLIMTEKYSSLPIIKGMELDVPENLSVIFGSSFPKDQEFTQVCRDINKIKICMETGRTVILLNMENLYESLYDALNQYYVEFGGKNYVDLGLGTHRVRCRVHEDFKLIVVADKKVVYELFPIPLINRLEKHFLTMTSSLEPYQLRHAKKLMEWAKQVATNSNRSKSTEEGMFVGYNSDTCGAIIMQLCQKGVQEDQLFERGQDALIKIATPDGILRSKNKHMIQTYFNNQKHDSLKLYLQDQLSSQNPSKYLQVTTYSRLLSLNECQTIAGEDSSVTMFSLVQFETDHSFRHSIKTFLETKKSDEQKNFLFIQYNMTATSGNLITCAQHITEELCLQHTLQDNTFIVFILQITRRFDSTLSGLSCSQAHWDYIHIDDLREPDVHMPSFMKYLDRPMSDLFAPDCQEDLSMLIKGSVPSAMKTLNTMGETRIDELAAKLRVVNHLFDKNKVFSTTVISEIHKQLLHKESQVLPEHSKGWVMREAVEQHYIPNYGTFRASLALCVEDKVIPVWKSLLTLMDENSNLMVLHQGMELYGGLWTLLFQAFTSSGEHNEKPIEESKQSNYSRFPFSKRISLMLDNVMQTYVIGASEEDKRENLSKAMNGLSINSLLSNLSNEQIEDYKKDFLMYKFPGLAQQGYQILNDNMSWSAAQQSDGEPQAAHSRIGDIHVAHQVFERSCLAKVFSFKPDLLLRSLFFDKSILKNIDRTVLKFLLNHYNKLFEETDVHSIQKINSELQKLNKFLKDVFLSLDIDVFPNIKLMWEKLQIVQIFIQHVINENGALDTILIFWNSLESDLHMCISEEGGWLTIETIFTETIRSSYNPSFRQACCQCLISLLDEFIIKKCGQSPHMVETALRYIFHASVDIPSSQISPVEGFAIHSTPMLKMYLLQSLIQRNIDVEEYLERFLEERLLLLENLNVIDICKMFMFTYQDKLSREVFGNISLDEAYHSTSLLSNIATEMRSATFYLTSSTLQTHQPVTLDSLKMVAKLRMCFEFVSKMMYQRFLTNTKFNGDVCGLQDDLFHIVLEFLTSSGRETEPHLFILRNVIFDYGFDELKLLVKKSGFNFGLNFEEIAESLNSDPFLVYGGPYVDVKRKLPHDITQLPNKKNGKDLLWSLGTMQKYILSVPPQGVKNNARKVGNENFIYNVQMMELDGGLKQLLHHFNCILDHCDDPQSLLYFFKVIKTEPSQSQKWYFPTMPSDPFAVVDEFRKKNTNMNFVPHACPNGHIYVITECGRAYTEAKCPEKGCGLRIGGHAHILDKKNKQVESRDNTERGHCLGSIKERKYDSGERDLNNLSTALIRFLLHMAMLSGDAYKTNQALNITLKERDVTSVESFLIAHLKKDLEFIKSSLDRNNEETRLALHVLLKIIADKKSTSLGFNLPEMQDQKKRSELETRLDQVFIKPFCHSYEMELRKFQNALADTQTIYRDLYEIEIKENTSLSPFNVMTSTFLWCYRLPVTFNHFKGLLQNKASSNSEGNRQLITLFEKTYIYEIMELLPDIIEFQSILYKHLNFQLDKATSRQTTLKSVLETLPADSGKRLNELKESIFKVWNILRSDLKNHGLFQREKNFPDNEMDENWPISFFLSSDSGDGRYLKTLLVLMATAQNELLGSYKELATLPTPLSKKGCRELDKSDVIIYRPEEDLKPLVYRYSDFSIRCGEGRFVTYHYDDIETRLMEHVCFDKCLIDTASIPMYRYQDEIRGTDRFLNLSRKMKQVAIGPSEQRQMMSELIGVHQVSDTLKGVEIAIGFLSSTGGEPSLLYAEYLKDILHMELEKFLPSMKMQDEITLSHLSSCWTMLTVERALRSQNPFACEQIFMEGLDFDQLAQTRLILDRLDLHILIGLLTEYIVCDLPMRGPNDVTFELGEALFFYNEERKAYDTDLIESMIEQIPMDIQVAHAEPFWKEVAAAFKQNHPN